MIGRRILVLAAAALVAACGSPDAAKIDGASPEAYRESLAAVRADLTPAQRAKFEAALKLHQANAFAAANSRAEFDAVLRSRLDGKTADDVVFDAAKQGGAVAGAAADAVFDIKRQVTEGVADVQAAAEALEGQ